MLPVLFRPLRCRFSGPRRSPQAYDGRYGRMRPDLAGDVSCRRFVCRLWQHERYRCEHYAWIHLHLRGVLLRRHHPSSGLVSCRGALVRNASQGHGILKPLRQRLWPSQQLRLAHRTKQDRLAYVPHFLGLVRHSARSLLLPLPRD